MTSSSEYQVKSRNWFHSLGRKKAAKTEKKMETMTVSRSFANLHSVSDGKIQLNNARSTPHLPSQIVSQCRTSVVAETIENDAEVHPPIAGYCTPESDVGLVGPARFKKSTSSTGFKIHFRKKTSANGSTSNSQWDLNLVQDGLSDGVELRKNTVEITTAESGIARKRSSTMTAIKQMFESNTAHYGGKFEKSRSRDKLHSNHVVVDTSETSVTNNRSRMFSTSSLDRRQFRKKRSTIWYQQDVDLYRKHQLKDEIAEVTAEMESMDSGEESKNAARAKQLSLGRKKFNMDPKKGIEFLVQQGLLQNTPQDIAAFLYRGEGLSKTAIGDYLGEKSPFHEQVLKAFVDLHDFTDLILVQALRQFLWSFRLPGEAQKIDRMMETFAQRYCQLNPNIFSNTDTCYVLSFAVIMLNTSLHNPSVKEKPTVEQFIAMNRGINDGKDLPRDILESLYDSIKAEPFKIPEDDGNDLMHTFFNPDREGWLWKQGGRYKSWKRRWFILNDNCLYYFEYTTDKEPRGIIPLENIQVREVQDRNKPNCFELYATGGNDFIKACKTDSEGKVVEGKHTVYRMSASTQEEKDDWINRIRQSISHNPFYDMLAARKKKAQKSGQRSKP